MKVKYLGNTDNELGLVKNNRYEILDCILNNELKVYEFTIQTSNNKMMSFYYNENFWSTNKIKFPQIAEVFDIKRQFNDLKKIKKQIISEELTIKIEDLKKIISFILSEKMYSSDFCSCGEYEIYKSEVCIKKFLKAFEEIINA